jgi:methylmalonyl-CoA/ethylmalonyl-CoA epimerase
MGDPPPPQLRLGEIGQIAVPVGDIDRAVAFYRDTLGLRFLFQAPPGLGFFDCAGIRLMLDGSAAAAPEPRASVLYFRAADLDAAHAALVAQRVPFEAPPHLVATLPEHELWMAFFRDPDGNLLALMSERPIAAPGS